MGALQLNPQAYWMVPVSDVLIFGACGLLVAAAATLCRSRRLCAVGVFGLFFVSALAVLLTFRGLTALACSVFAAGLAYQLTARLLARPGAPARLVRRGLPALLALVALLACLGPGREKLDEHRLVQAPTGSPNVLFIVLDTVRAESLSALRIQPRHLAQPDKTGAARRSLRPGANACRLDTSFTRQHVHRTLALRALHSPRSPARHHLSHARRGPPRSGATPPRVSSAIPISAIVGSASTAGFSITKTSPSAWSRSSAAPTWGGL